VLAAHFNKSQVHATKDNWMHKLVVAALIGHMPLSVGAADSLAGRQACAPTLGAVVSTDGRLLLGNASFVQKNQDLEGTYYAFFPNDVRKWRSQHRSEAPDRRPSRRRSLLRWPTPITRRERWRLRSAPHRANSCHVGLT